MQYIITAYDAKTPEAPMHRKEVRPRHLENIAKVQQYGRFVCAGGIMNEQGTPAGSFLILDFSSREDLETYLATEPYIVEKVWETVRVEVCSVVIQNDEMVGK